MIPQFYSYARNRDLETEAGHAAKILGRPERDRSLGWSASSAGTCLRAQLFKSRKADAKPFSDATMGHFQHGHYVHLKHQTAGLTAGYLIEAEASVSIPELNVLGTMDGIDSSDDVTEFKSINPRGFSGVKQFGPLDEHLHQVNAYMWASGRGRARILYENKADCQMVEYPLELDEKYDTANKRDWRELNDRAEDGSLPPMLPECQRQEGRFKWCPFADVCLMEHQSGRRKLRIRRTSSSGDD